MRDHEKEREKRTRERIVAVERIFSRARDCERVRSGEEEREERRERRGERETLSPFNGCDRATLCDFTYISPKSLKN